MQLDLDYSKVIRNLEAKARRQQDALSETEAQIAAFKGLQAYQLKADQLKKK